MYMGIKKKKKKKEGKREEEKLNKTLSACTELMSPGVTDLEYLMLKLLGKSLILGLAQGPAHTVIQICSFATGEIPIIMDGFNKL